MHATSIGLAIPPLDKLASMVDLIPNGKKDDLLIHLEIEEDWIDDPSIYRGIESQRLLKKSLAEGLNAKRLTSLIKLTMENHATFSQKEIELCTENGVSVLKALTQANIQLTDKNCSAFINLLIRQLVSAQHFNILAPILKILNQLNFLDETIFENLTTDAERASEECLAILQLNRYDILNAVKQDGLDASSLEFLIKFIIRSDSSAANMPLFLAICESVFKELNKTLSLNNEHCSALLDLLADQNNMEAHGIPFLFALEKLNKTHLLKDAYFKLIANNPFYAEDISEALITLHAQNILDEANFQAIANHIPHAIKISHAFTLLKAAGILNAINRQDILDNPGHAIDISQYLVAEKDHLVSTTTTLKQVGLFSVSAKTNLRDEHAPLPSSSKSNPSPSSIRHNA